MIKVVIIGSGNVAQHLILAFQKAKNVSLVQVLARDCSQLLHLLPSSSLVSDYNLLLPADVYIIAVSDDAITTVSNAIPFTNQLVVHTSGGVAMNELNAKNRSGVFYPLQTFSKSKAVDFSIVPICIEANHEEDYTTLETLAKAISKATYKVNSEQRKALHVSAVFVANFVNHLYHIGNTICQENQLDFEILKPLIQETAHKILTLAPSEAQTGPAKRQDTQTINSHLAFLTDENQKEIYKLLTKSIIDNGKKL